MGKRPPFSWVIVSVCTVAFLFRFDFYGLSVALPTIAKYFKVSTENISLIFTTYLVFVSAGLLIAGRIEDKIGLKNGFNVGFIAFIVGSLLASISPSELFLVLSRAVQGIGGAFLISSTFATVSQHFSKTTSVAVFGFVAISTELGSSFGSPAGGLLTEWVSWRGLFLADSLLGAFGLLSIFMASKDFKKMAFKKDPRPLDIIGCLFWFLSIGLLIFALNKGHRLGWSSAVFLTLFLSSLLFGVLFYFRESRYAYPLFPMKLIGGIQGLGALLVGFLAFSLIAGNSFLLPFFLEHVKMLTPSQVGLVFLAYSASAAIVGLNAGKFARLASQRVLISVALALISIGFATMFFTINLDGFFHIFAFLIIMGIGFGLFFPNNNSLLMSHAPAGEKGVFSGLFNTFNNVGGALGACVFEIVYAWETSHIKQLAANDASDTSWMIHGFKDSYLLAVIIGVTSLLISLILLLKKPQKS